MSLKPSNHVILGSGVAGLSAAYHLDEPYEIFESSSEIGGVAGSFFYDGFTFDHAIHVMFTRDAYVSELIRALLGENFQEHDRSAWIYSAGVFTPYPYQNHNFGLPDAIIRENLAGLWEAQRHRDDCASSNFEEWIYDTFGKGIATNFMIPFNKKVWAADLQSMGHSWIKNRVAIPDGASVLRGAFSPDTTNFGPNAHFWYPLRGGTAALPQAFAARVDPVRTDMHCVGISHGTRQIHFANGESRNYRSLISTIPLPSLCALLSDDPPTSIQEGVSSLRWNRVITVNMGIARPQISKTHWIYFPDDHIEFHRVSFPSNFSQHASPEGTSSIMVEFSESATRPIERRGLTERTINTLINIGILEPSDTVIFSRIHEIEPAYIIQSPDHEAIIENIHTFLRSRDIISCGRFGEWRYLNMDDSILSGKRAAEQVTQLHIRRGDATMADP